MHAKAAGTAHNAPLQMSHWARIASTIRCFL